MGICLIIKSGGGIDTSSATVTADKILSGYTIYSNDNKVTGTMANIGSQTESGKGVGSSTTIKAGWHNGNGIISTSELKSQMSATTASVGDVLASYTYWTNGSNSRYTGTMANRGTKTWSLGANGSQTIEGGWHNGSGTVKQSINVDTGEWGPNPTTTNQQLCWQGWYYSKNRWCYGSSALIAANIKKDITIFGVKGTYEDTTKKFIIKNGQLISTYGPYLWYRIGSSSLVPSETVSYNNSTWHMIYGKRWWIDSNDTVHDTLECMLNIPSVTKWITINATFTQRGFLSTFTMSGIVRGDLVIPGTVSGATRTTDCRMSVTTRITSAGGGVDQWGYWPSLNRAFNINWGSTVTASMPTSDLSCVSTVYGSGPLGTMTIHANVNTPPNVTFGIYAKNLWIDTTTAYNYKG